MSFIAGFGLTNCDLLYSGCERLPVEGEEIFSQGFDMQLGGGIPATMINLARLGVPTKFCTLLGDDFFSNYAKEQFNKYNANFVNIYQGEGKPVVITSAVITKRDRTFISYTDDHKVTSKELDLFYENSKGAKVCEMGLDYLEVYRKLKAEGTTLVFDTGWLDDLSLEKYADYIKIADYYTPNKSEALKITGASTPQEALEILSKHFEKAIVKVDSMGCLIKEDGKITTVPVMKDVISVDSTGAGDAFKSGFMYGLFHGYSFEDCIKFGNVTGGTCVTGVGCLTKYVNETELLEKMKKL